MEAMARHCWKFQCNGISSFRYLYNLRFFSKSVKITAEEEIFAASYSLFSLANFLVGSLEFSKQQALSISTKLTESRQSGRAKKVGGFNFIPKAELVISFLQRKGLDKTQIRNVVYSAPQILKLRVEQTLEPKMKVFEEMGLSGSDFADVISTQPGILGFGLHSTICPALEALREVMGSDENVVKVIKGFKLYNFRLVSKHLVSNVSLLRARGIPDEIIRKHIFNQSLSFIQKTEKFKDIVIQVEEKWGVSPSSPMFLYAVNLLCCQREENIESKCQLFESFGWDRSHVVDLFRRKSTCLGASKGKIKAMLSFFMNELGYDPGYILRQHGLLNYSLEKRLLPRLVVFQLLKQKRLIRENLAVCTAFTLSEPKFLRKFVLPFQHVVPSLHDLYVNSKGPPLEQQSHEGRKPFFPKVKWKP